jgi:hypothetical protein
VRREGINPIGQHLRRFLNSLGMSKRTIERTVKYSKMGYTEPASKKANLGAPRRTSEPAEHKAQSGGQIGPHPRNNRA